MPFLPSKKELYKNTRQRITVQNETRPSYWGITQRVEPQDAQDLVTGGPNFPILKRSSLAIIFIIISGPLSVGICCWFGPVSQ